MKIAFITDKDSNHSQRWVGYFSNNNDINVLAIKRLNSKFLEILVNIFSVRGQINKTKPDLLHAHYAGVNGILAALSGFHPFIVTAWGSDIMINPKKNLLMKLITKYILKKADLITCDAEHMKKAMIDLGINPSKIKIIFFGVNTKKFVPGEKDKNLQKIVNIIPNSYVVISLRRLEPICDVGTFIRAIPLILREFPKSIFIIIGNGSQEKELKNLANYLGVSENIRFMGWISEEEMPRYLRTADIYVSTSLSDGGIAASTAEAMSCGLPIVITDFGDNKEWVKDGESGFLAPLKNPKVLAEKIVLLLKDENLRKEMGSKNRKIIEEKNDYYKEMGKMKEIYYQLAKRKNESTENNFKKN